MISNDTIAAQATPFGYSGVGVLRISGIKANYVAKLILGKIPKPRYAEYLIFKDIKGVIIDKGIALWFPNPYSFTGEDVLELHSHGGPLVMDLLLNNILKINGVRIANPGEFSERAFLNSKLDLIQAEAIIDLINATSEHMVRSAINSLQGMFSNKLNNILEKIKELRIYTEAYIDFPEEETNFFSKEEIKNQLDDVISNIEILHHEACQGQLINKDGIKTVIIGLPNAGKSSILNKLAGKDTAIVTDIAGTTRDLLHEYIQINGIMFHIIDTTGLHITDDKIEKIGIERTWKAIESSDQILFIIDSTKHKTSDLEKICPNFISRIKATNIPITIVRNKIDMTNELSGFIKQDNHSIINISALNGDGIDILRNYLKQITIPKINTESNFLTKKRHIKALETTIKHLKKSRFNLEEVCSIELLAEELRLGQKSLDIITGKFTSEDLLNEIFSNFCIGK